MKDAFIGNQGPRNVAASSTKEYWFSMAAGAIFQATMSRPRKAQALAEVARVCLEAAKGAMP